MSTNIAIEKLDGTNFHTWKLKIKMILIREDVWDVVNGETPAPASSSEKEGSTTALKTWKKTDQKALSSKRKDSRGNSTCENDSSPCKCLKMRLSPMKPLS